MTLNPTLEGLRSLKLFGMVKALEAQIETPGADKLSFEERLGMLVDHELTSRNNKRLSNRLKQAKLRFPACIEDLDLNTRRGLNRSEIVQLSTCSWIQKHQNIIVEGKTGVGKSYLSCAFAEKACREGFSTIYFRTSRLFEEIAVSKVEGRFHKFLDRLVKVNLLVLDDFGIVPFAPEHSRDLFEIVEDRYDRQSTIISGQLPVENWHEAIGDDTIADAILDRLVHNAYRIKLKGPSKRTEMGKEDQNNNE